MIKRIYDPCKDAYIDEFEYFCTYICPDEPDEEEHDVESYGKYGGGSAGIHTHLSHIDQWIVKTCALNRMIWKGYGHGKNAMKKRLQIQNLEAKMSQHELYYAIQRIFDDET
jgi:hypothetical protein